MGKTHSRYAPVSVVIPCYCCDATINRAVASVADQTVLPQELILVDDASPDSGRTLDELHALSARYAGLFPVKVVALQQNSGVASARNAGWEAATCNFVAFLDADDTWHPRKIEIQHGYMAANATIGLSGHGHVVGDRLVPVEPSAEVWPISAWWLRLRNPFITPSVMLRRNMPDRFLDGQRFMEDHLLWMRLHCHGVRMVKLAFPLAVIHKRPYGDGGLSAKLWQMEKSDVGNYFIMVRAGCLHPLWLLPMVVLSLLKFFRRILLITLRRIIKS